MAFDALRKAMVNGSVSPWVWVLLAFAIGYALLLITQMRTFQLLSISGIAFSVGDVLVAAALMYVAPRSRLVQLAAIGFAAPMVLRAVDLLITSELVLLLGTPSSSYLAFAQSVRELTDAFSDVAFIFKLVAIVAVAAYVGRIRTNGGWLIVAISAVLAAAQAFVIASTAPSTEFFPAHAVALWIVAPVTLVGWGYLLGVVIERRRLLLSAAAAVVLARAVLDLLTQTVFSQVLTAGPDNPILAIFSATTWGLTVVYWLTLIGGVLLELRPDRHIASTPGPAWQPDPSGLRP